MAKVSNSNLAYRGALPLRNFGPDTFQTPSRHHPDTIQTPSRHLPDTFQTPSRDLPDTFQTPSRHIPDTFQTPSRHHPDTIQTQSRHHPDTIQTPSRHHPDTIQTLSRHPPACNTFKFGNSQNSDTGKSRFRTGCAGYVVGGWVAQAMWWVGGQVPFYKPTRLSVGVRSESVSQSRVWQ